MKNKTRWVRLMVSALVVGICAGYSSATSLPTQGTDAMEAVKLAASSAEPARQGHGKVLRFGVHVSEMGTLDPHFAAGSQDRALADMIFNGLLRYQPGNAPQIEPDLAEAIPEFKMLNGRQVWSVSLRKGVFFHPGPMTEAYEMTAEDVVFSLKKSSHSSRCAYAGEYAGLTFERTGRYTLDIIPDKPLSPILFLPKLTNYAGGFIVSKKAVETMGYERFKMHPVGTGPFVFNAYRPGEKLILTANPQYFRGRPWLEGVEIYLMPDIKVREAALKSGEVDVIVGHGEKGWPEKMEQERGIVIDTHGVGEVSAIYFNTEMKPFDDVRVRRAIAFALNRELFRQTLSQRLVGAIFSPVPAPFMPGGLAGEEVKRLGLMYATDREKAKQLLTEAGYPNGFTLNLMTSKKRIYRSLYESLQEQLAKIGIHCQLTVVTHAEMHKQIRQNPKPVVIYVAWRPNADIILSRFFHSDSIVVTGANPDTNFSHYRKIDNLIEDARLEINPEKQINLWKQAQIRILDDMAAYPIMYTTQVFARRAYVDYGHPLVATMALYPQFTEKTRMDGGR